jgi:hypothetical protein
LLRRPRPDQIGSSPTGFRNASHWLNCEAAIVIIAFPPDEPAAAKAIAAAPWLPGWPVSFVPLDAAARTQDVSNE